MRDAKLLPRCKCGRSAPIGKRKCGRCLSTKGYKVTTLRASTKGMNVNRATKSYTRRAKRQNTSLLGAVPQLRMSGL